MYFFYIKLKAKQNPWVWLWSCCPGLWRRLRLEDPEELQTCSESCNISLPSIFPGLDDCSPRTFQELLLSCSDGFLSKNKAHSPENLIISNKNLHSLVSRIWSYTCRTQERKKEQSSNYFLPTFCLINPFSSLVAQFIFYYYPRRQLQKWNT